MKLVMLKGLPASGKSTYAKELVKQGYKRVNKDDLRAMIDDGKWSEINEKNIRDMELHLVVEQLNKGKNVVVDSTNFAYEDYWQHIAEKAGAEFEVKFFDVPVQECIERDARRGDKSVGKKVILGMYNKYLHKEPEKVAYDGSLLDCYIFDIDGTLATMGNRSPYDWSKVGVDTVNESVRDVLRSLRKDYSSIIILSGRDSICRGETEDWLNKNGISYGALYMRPEGDMRKDVEVKEELYNNHIKGKYNILGVFDDRLQVCRLWYKLGLSLFRVGNPDAEF